MSIKLFGLKASFVFFALSSVHAADLCPVRILVKMPAKRNQGSTGDCYAFAALGLTENFYCKNKVGGCAADDQLSALDAIALTNHRRLQSGGQTPEVLMAINNEHGLFKESCAPFTPFIKSDNVFSLIRKAMAASAVESLKAQDRAAIATRLKSDLNLNLDIVTLQSILTKKDASIVAYDLFIPKECEDKRVSFRKFAIKNFSSDRIEEIRSQMMAQLARGIPVETDICAFANLEGKKETRDTCGPHALIVSGIRANEFCSYEYQFYDSGTTFADWVSEKTYFDLLRRRSRLSGPGHNDLTWIE